MPAYSRPLETRCQAEGCARRATHEVFDTWNRHHGNFCTSHAGARVKRLNAVSTEPAVKRGSMLGKEVIVPRGGGVALVRKHIK